MSQTFHSLYSSIYETYQKTYKDKAKKDCQDETNKIWLVLKKEFKNISELSVAVEKKLQELRQIQLKKSQHYFHFGQQFLKIR
jgi:L-2-hydroxyglutarate oxidase LhgO